MTNDPLVIARVVLIWAFIIFAISLNSFYIFFRTDNKFGRASAHIALASFICAWVYDVVYMHVHHKLHFWSLFVLLAVAFLTSGPGDWLIKKAKAAMTSLTDVAQAAFKRDATAC